MNGSVPIEAASEWSVRIGIGDGGRDMRGMWLVIVYSSGDIGLPIDAAFFRIAVVNVTIRRVNAMLEDGPKHSVSHLKRNIPEMVLLPKNRKSSSSVKIIEPIPSVGSSSSAKVLALSSACESGRSLGIPDACDTEGICVVPLFWRSSILFTLVDIPVKPFSRRVSRASSASISLQVSQLGMTADNAVLFVSRRLTLWKQSS